MINSRSAPAERQLSQWPPAILQDMHTIYQMQRIKTLQFGFIYYRYT